MLYKARHVAISLCAKGFREEHKRDHRYYFYYHNGKKSSIHTKISHNADEVDGDLGSAMSWQMKLTRDQFKTFVECPMKAEDYLKLMIQAQHLSP